MSPGAFDLGMRLAALTAARAVPATSTRRVHIHPDATLVAVRTMAGVDGSLFGVAVGRLGDAKAKVAVAADPIINTEQARCFAEIGHLAGEHPHPSLVVSSKQACLELEWAAKRAEAVGGDEVMRGVDIVHFCIGREHIAGADSLVIACDALTTHFAWPGQELDSGDLARCVAWVDGESPDLLGERIGGVRTPVDLDSSKLAKLVKKHRDERRKLPAGARDDTLHRQRPEIAVALGALLRDDWALLKRAGMVIEEMNRPALPDAEKRCENEVAAWVRQGTSAEKGFRPNLRSSPRRAVTVLERAEQSLQSYRAVVLRYDELERLRAADDGRVLLGQVAAVDGAEIVVTSSQTILRIRAGDVLSPVDQSDIRLRVRELRESVGGRECVFESSSEDPVFTHGDEVCLLLASGGWGGGGKPWSWTHPARGGVAPGPSKSGDVDAMVAAVERFRTKRSSDGDDVAER